MATYNETNGNAVSPFGQFIQKTQMVWGTLVLGLAGGFVGMNLFVTRPLAARIEGLQREVAAVERDMEELVGIRDEVWETSNLLSSLKAQHQQLADANEALRAIRQFRVDLQTESEQTVAAVASLEGMINLQDAVLDQRDLIAPAAKSFNEIVTLHDRLVLEQQTTPSAAATLSELIQVKELARKQSADVVEAQGALEQLVDLKARVQAQADIAEARNELQQLIDVKDLVLDNTLDIAEAQTASSSLLALKDQMILQGGDVDTARAHIENLYALRDELAENNGDMPTAAASLDALLEMKTKLIAQTADLADAVQTLEILADFQQEFQERIASLGKMRQGLMEIMLMETTIGRVCKALEPLSQLGNLRRMGDSELREAARVILEQRNTRITQKPAEPEFHFGVEPAHPEIGEVEGSVIKSVPAGPVPAPIDLE